MPIAVGFALGVSATEVAFTVAVLPVAALVALTDLGRLCIFVFGGLFVLGQQGNVTVAELAFMCFAIGMSLIARARCTQWVDDAYVKKCLDLQVVLVVGVATWWLVGLWRGAPVIDATRDDGLCPHAARASVGTCGWPKSFAPRSEAGDLLGNSYCLRIIRDHVGGEPRCEPLDVIPGFGLGSTALVALGVATATAEGRQSGRNSRLLLALLLIGGILIAVLERDSSLWWTIFGLMKKARGSGSGCARTAEAWSWAWSCSVWGAWWRRASWTRAF